MKELIKKVIRSTGFELFRYPHHQLRTRINLINYFNINKIFDVGANEGQYAIESRKIGFNGEIISFEPLEPIFPILSKHAGKDSKWEVYNYALGDFDGDSIIHVAEGYVSSSMLDMLPGVISGTINESATREQRIQVKKMDSIFELFYKENDNVFLKIDAQGYEKNIIDGAENSLSRIKGLQLEMSIKPLYNGELTYLQMIPYLEERGFVLYTIENGWTNPKTGELLQIDGIFFRIPQL